MSKLTVQEERRAQILQELAQLRSIRRGSVTEQHVEVVGKDGRRYKRGPYPVYTFKEKGKTISRRLSNPDEVKAVRQQIEAGRRFQELTRELMRLGESLGNLTLDASIQKKTSKLPWSKNSRPPKLSNR